MIKVVDGQMQIFGMNVPKVLVIGLVVAVVQYLTGDHQGAVNTTLIALGIQKGGDSISSAITALLNKK